MPDKSVIDEFWRIFYCPADRNHKLVSKFRYTKHILACNTLLKKRRYECQYTNAHQYFSEMDL